MSLSPPEQETPLVVVGGKEYGTGSSRDWAAKGAALLGVRSVLVESFERIHRSNLVGMGVLPLQFPDGQNAKTLEITGEEVISIDQPSVGDQHVKVCLTRPSGATASFDARVRIDTPKEWEYYINGGILPFMVRQLVG